MDSKEIAALHQLMAPGSSSSSVALSSNADFYANDRSFFIDGVEHQQSVTIAIWTCPRRILELQFTVKSNVALAVPAHPLTPATPSFVTPIYRAGVPPPIYICVSDFVTKLDATQ